MTLSSVQERTETATVASVHGLQTIDYDNDGILDLVGLIDQTNVGSSAALYAWHGVGDGTFDVPVSLGVSQVADLVVVDVNNDGKKDLVMSTWDNQLIVKRGNGSGFEAPQAKALDHNEVRIAAVSMDGDAYVDLVGTATGYGFFVVYHGVGDGTFTETKRVSTGSVSPFAVAVADFDGDGRVDVAYGNYADTASIHVAFQNADGTFATPVVLQSGQPNSTKRDFPEGLAVADLNEDGKPDLVATNWQDWPPTDSVAIFLNNGSRTFTKSVIVPRMTSAYGYFQPLIIKDINGDGHFDIIAGSLNGGTVMTSIGNGDGTFLSPTYYDRSDESFISLAAGLFGSDGSMRLAAGLTQKLLAAKYTCASQAYLFTVSPVISVGQSAPLRVLVSGIGASTPLPRGTVTFHDGATTLGTADVDATGYAALDASGLSAGSHTITADFSGNTSVAATTSNSTNEFVTTATTTTTIALPASSLSYGTDLTFNVNITSSTGPQPGPERYDLTVDGVTTKQNSYISVTLKLSAGSHTLSAAFYGDSSYPPSSSGPQQVTITKATPSITTPSASVLTVRSGSTHVLPFVVQGPAGYAGPTGTLQITENGNVIASGALSSGAGTLSTTLQRGAHDVVVTYSGDANFNSTSVSLTLVVLQNLPLTIEARGLQNAISIRAVLPSNTTSTSLYRSPSGANSWTLVNGWTPDVELDSSVTTRGVLFDYRLTVVVSGVPQTSNVDSAMLFTDDPVSSVTLVKRTHFDELRTAINAQRAVAGLAPFDFDGTYAGTLIRASHLASMRTALTEARQALGMAAPVFTDSASTSTPIRAVHIQELRNQSR